MSNSIISTSPDKYFEDTNSAFLFKNRIGYIDFTHMKYETYRFIGVDNNTLWEPYDVFIKLYYNVPHSISKITLSSLISVLIIDKCHRTTYSSTVDLFSKYIYYDVKALLLEWNFDISFTIINNLKIFVFSYHNSNRIYYDISIYKEKNLINTMFIVYDLENGNSFIPGAIALAIVYGHIQEYGIDAIDEMKIRQEISSVNRDYETQKASDRISIMYYDKKDVLETLKSKYGICFISKHNILLIYYDSKTKRLIRHIGFTTGRIQEYPRDVSEWRYYKPDNRTYKQINYELPAINLTLETIQLTYHATVSKYGRHIIESILELQYCTLYEISNEKPEYHTDINKYLAKKLEDTKKLCLSDDKYIYTISNFEVIKDKLFLLKVMVIREVKGDKSLYALLRFDDKGKDNLEATIEIYDYKKYEDEDIIILEDSSCIPLYNSIICKYTGEIIEFSGSSLAIVDTKQHKIGIIEEIKNEKIKMKTYSISKPDNKLKFLTTSEYDVKKVNITIGYYILGNIFLYVLENSLIFLDLEGNMHSVITGAEDKNEYAIAFIERIIKLNASITLVAVSIKKSYGHQNKYKDLLFIIKKKDDYLEIIYGIPVKQKGRLFSGDFVIENKIYLMVDKNVLSRKNKKVTVSNAERLIDCMFNKDHSKLHILAFDILMDDYFILPFFDTEIQILNAESIIIAPDDKELLIKAVKSIDIIREKEYKDANEYKILIVNNKITLTSYDAHHNIITDDKMELVYMSEYNKPVIVAKSGLNIVFSYKTAYNKCVAIIR